MGVGISNFFIVSFKKYLKIQSTSPLLWPLFSKSLKKNHKIHSAPEARQNTFLHFTLYQIKVYSYSAVELNSCSIAFLYLESQGW